MIQQIRVKINPKNRNPSDKKNAINGWIYEIRVNDRSGRTYDHCEALRLERVGEIGKYVETRAREWV